MSFVTKNFDQILQDFIAYVVANSTQITDMNPGSVIRSFAEGLSLSLEELYIGTYLGFKRYLENIQENNYDFPRKGGTKSSTTVIFSRAGTTGDKTIPINTRLKTPTGLRFVTSSAVTILNGQTASPAVEVVADVVGITHNVNLGTITVIEDTVDGVDSVTNAIASTGGVDIESDYNYKKRFQAYIEGLGRSNLSGILYGASSVEGVTSVSAVEHFPPATVDSKANVSVAVYVDDSSALGISDALLLTVQNTLDGDGTAVSPGFRAGGVNVIAVKPSIQTEDVTASVSIIDGVDTDQVESDINSAISQYINTLGVGVSIIYNEIVSAIMSVYGVTDVDVTAPSGNVAVSATQVGRVGTITIT